MSIATDSETTSVEARGGLLPRELRRKATSRFGSYRTGERRRAIVTANLLCSDLISAFVALFTVDSIFGLSLTETALTGLPILIGLFYVSGLYSSRLAPASVCGQTPWHPRFRRHVFRGLRRILPVKHLDRGRAPGDCGVSARLLRRSPDAPCPHSAQVVGCGDDLRRQRRSHRASPQLAVSNSRTWSSTGRPRDVEARRQIARMSSSWSPTKRDFARIRPRRCGIRRLSAAHSPAANRPQRRTFDLTRSASP